MESKNKSMLPLDRTGEQRLAPEADSSFNILLVDDEINILKTLSLYLETEGHKVIAVSNLQDALAQASRRSFDLAFVDLRLGKSNGLDLIPTLLSITPWLKIIVITAYVSIETVVEAIRRGAIDYLGKPFTPSQVKLAIQNATKAGLSKQARASPNGSAQR